jgi:hypothetical protein
MGPTNKLIQEFARQRHPLGRSIPVAEAPALTEALRQRLGASTQELDLSPASLKRLEQRLINLHQAMQEQGQTFSDEELVRLVREIAAYVGQVLLIHAEGKWQTMSSLWNTEVVFEGPVEGVKGKEVRVYPVRVFSLGNIAASSWDATKVGKIPKLYQVYRDARAKRLREKL